MYDTLISSDTEIYKTLLKAERKNKVRFSGKFFISDQDYIYLSNFYRRKGIEN